MQTNLNILEVYSKPMAMPADSVTVEQIDEVIKFCAAYGTEFFLTHKDGMITKHYSLNGELPKYMM